MASLDIALQVLKYGATVSTVVIGGFAVYLHYIHKKYAHLPSPPRDSFWFGHIPTVKKMRGKGLMFHEIILNFAEQYGDTFVLHFIQSPMVITLHPELIKDLLVTGNHPKSKRSKDLTSYLHGARFMGNSIVTIIEHDEWSKRRSYVNPAFHRSFLRDMMEEFNNTSDKLLNVLFKSADGVTVVPMLDLMNRTTLDVIGKVGFGMDINSLEDDTNPFTRAISTAFKGFSEMIKSPFRRLVPFVDQPFRKDVRESLNFLRATGKRLLEERYNEMLKGVHIKKDIFSHIIESHGLDKKIEGEKLEETIDDFVIFFIAGQETTANAMAYIVMELGRRPDIFQKMYKEVQEVIGVKSSITMEDLGKLNYLTQVIKEGLRLAPPAAVTFREARSEINIKGAPFIPANSLVWISMFGSGRYSQFHEDPLTFNPDRFAPESSLRPPMYTYIPFSLGPRNCIGQNFAMIEAKVLLCKLVQHFEWTNHPDESFKLTETTTIKPKDGAQVILTLKNH